MTCQACHAFLSNYTSASERSGALVLRFEAMVKAGHFKQPALLKLKNEVETARIDSLQAKDALRVHKSAYRRPQFLN